MNARRLAYLTEHPDEARPDEQAWAVGTVLAVIMFLVFAAIGMITG